MTRPIYDFSDRIALVTGGGSGIGRATALKFAASGASVVLADLDEAASAAVCQEILARGGRSLFVRTDISRAADCDALVNAVLLNFGRLDFAFNNAGIFGRPQRLGSGEASGWQRVIDVNLTGLLNCLHSELRVMQSAGGSIVNCASVMGLRGGLGASAYCASKHGVIGATKAAALDHGPRGIRINAVCPGFVATPMTVQAGNFTDKAVAAAVARTALGRVASVEEIADSVLWLCSDGAAFVTGTALVVDGGFSAI